MKKYALLATLFLCGCTNPGTIIHDELGKLHGQPVSTVFAKLGYPQSEGNVAGRKFYLWSNNVMGRASRTKITQGGGQIDGKYFDYTETTIGGGIPYNMNCTIRVFVSKDDYVQFADGSGTNGACAEYAERLLQK